MKKYIKSLGLASLLFALPLTAFADSAPGDVIVTLGDNLSQSQAEALKKELGVSDKDTIVTVTNAEEHEYLGSYISKAQIGTKALSSSKITLGEEGTGLRVSAKNVTWVTEEAFVNALITAGVKDADIMITAPFAVSGTAALTGIIKAYEVTSGEKIPEEQKQVANEEMVKTAELGDSVGKEDATTLMARIKELIAEKKPETDEEVRALIEQAADELGVTLTAEEIDGLVSLFGKMKELNLDWTKVGDELKKAKDNFENYLTSDEGKGFVEKISSFFKSMIDSIKGFFN